MARPKGIPRINYQSGTNLARVTIDGRAFYIGKKDDGKHQNIYNWLIGIWMSNNRQLPADINDQLQARKAGIEPLSLAPMAAATVPELPHGMTVAELVDRYLEHAVTYYVKAGRPTSEYDAIVLATEVLVQKCGRVAAASFDVPDLEQVRLSMIARGWKSTTINSSLSRVRRCFRWGILKGLTGAEQCGRLRELPGAKAGREGVPQDEDVEAIDDATVAATLPFLNRHVAGIVRLMRETGMRCVEACHIRLTDCRDNNDGTWTYDVVDEANKMAHRDQARPVTLSPAAISIINQFSGREVDYVFRPAEAIEEQLAERRANRKTPLWPSHVRRYEFERQNRKPRQVGEHYTTDDVRKAIHRAVEAANEARLEDAAKKGVAADKVELLKTWNPNQLRHALATEWLNKGVNPKFVSAQLGHKNVGAMMSQVTEIYAKVEESTLRKLVLEMAK